MSNQNLREAVCVQFYPEDGEQAFVVFVDFKLLKESYNEPNHSKYHPMSKKLYNDIDAAFKDSYRIGSTDLDCVEAARKLNAKTPFRMNKKEVTLYY